MSTEALKPRTNAIKFNPRCKKTIHPANGQLKKILKSSIRQANLCLAWCLSQYTHLIPTHVFEWPWLQSRVLILHFIYFIYFILIYNIHRILSQLRIASSALRFLKENRVKVSSSNWDINTNQPQGFPNTSVSKCFPIKSINCLESTRLSQTFSRDSRAQTRCFCDASIDLHRYLTLLKVNLNFYRF